MFFEAIIWILSQSVALAVAGSAVFMLAAWRPWKRDGALGGGLWGGAAGLAAALTAVYLTADGWPGVPPVETWQWTVYVVIAAGLVGLLDAARRWPAPVRVAVYVLPAGLAAALLVPEWMRWPWRVAIAALVASSHWAINDRSARVRGGSVPLALAVAATGAGVVILESNNLKLFQLSVTLATGLGVCTVLAWWRPRVSLARGAAPVIAAALVALVLSARFLTYAPIPAWAFLLAAAAPLGLLIDRVAGISRLPPGPAAAALRVAAVLLPAAAAAVAAVAANLGGSDDY